MFEKNWNIIIVLLIIVLAIAYYYNNYEGFAGSVDAKNAEAIANVASIYNKDEVKVTNVTATNTVNLPRGGSINYALDDPKNFNIKYSNDGGMDGLMINSWQGGDFRTNNGGEKKIMWWNPGGVGMTDLYSNKIYVNGGVLETGDWDRFIIRSKYDDNDRGYWYFNKGGDHGYFNKEGKHNWRLLNDGQLCLGGTCINEGELANLKIAARRIYSQNGSDVIALNGMIIPNGCHSQQWFRFNGGCNLWENGRFDPRTGP